MSIPTNKEDLKIAIHESYQKLLSDLNGIPEKLTRLKELEGHAKNTVMSVCDLLAYLQGWGQLVLKWNRNKALGKHVDFPETGYQWNELGKLAQKFYADNEKQNFDTLRVELDKTVKEIMLVIAMKTNRQLYEEDWYDGWTLGRLIQLNTASPYKNASIRIRRWRKMRGIKK